MIPYLDEIPATAISRFLREIEVIDLVGTNDPPVIQQAIDSCSGKERNEAPELSMPEIHEHSWKKYESVKQNIMSKIKKGGKFFLFLNFIKLYTDATCFFLLEILQGSHSPFCRD